MRRLTTAALATLFLMVSLSALAETVISGSKKALIDELILISNAHYLGAGVVADLLSDDWMDPQNPVEVQFANMREIMLRNPEAREIIDESIANLYDRTFTEAELRQLIAFFRGNLGRKYAVMSLNVGPTVRGKLADAAGRLRGTSSEQSRTSVTISNLRVLATAVEAYGTDENRYPLAGNMEELEAIIVQVYIRDVPELDGWGNPFVYAGSRDGQSYRFVSGGPDGRIESANRRVGSKEVRKNDDLIFDTGEFVQRPEEKE